MLQNTHEYNFWFVFQRTEDVPGQWVGHCLELDVVSQGNSLQHTMSMLNEACIIVLGDDLGSGKDPLDRRAPESFWNELYTIIREGEKRDFSTLEENKVRTVASQVEIKLSVVQHEVHSPLIEQQSSMISQPLIPLTWTGPAPAQAACC